MAKKRYTFTFDAPVSILLVLAYIAVYALNISLQGRMSFPEGHSLIQQFFTCTSMNLKAPLDYLRLFCHVLGSQGWEPLLFNALLMLLLGRNAEKSCGHLTLAVTFFLSALVSGVLVCLIPNLTAQGPDPIIFMLLLLNFFACLASGSISFSWILSFLIFTAIRSYAIIQPLAPASFSIMLNSCIPIFISLAGGIAGSLPAFLMLSKDSSPAKTKAPARKKEKPAKPRRKNEATVVADMDDSFTDTLEI